MTRIQRIIVAGLLICLLGAAGNGYGQEVDIKTDKRYGGLVAAWNFDGSLEELISGTELRANKGKPAYTLDRNLGEGKSLLIKKGQIFKGLFDSLPTGDSARTVMFWLRKTGCGDADIALLEFGDRTKPRGVMNIRLRPCAEWGDYMTTSFVPDLNEKHKYSDALKDGLHNAMWRHVAVTYSSGTVSMYYDGSIATTSNSNRAAVDTVSSVASFGWVANPDERDDSVICLDDVRVFSSKFNSRRIKLVYENEMSTKLEVDTDGDQLSDINEVYWYGTDPKKADTDDDGLSDSFELRGGVSVVEGNFNWHSAQEDAEKRDGHLATITSAIENSVIQNLLLDKYQGIFPSLWLGATDQVEEGDWKWVTGEEWGYENWDSENGEPNNDNGGLEDYLQIIPSNIGWNGGKWNDLRAEGNSSGSSWNPVGYVIEYHNQYTSDPNKSDTDSDGFSDEEENTAKTNPTDATSYPSSSANISITELEKAPFSFSFKTEKNKTYVVQATGDLLKWNLVETLQGTGSAVQFTDTREALFEEQYYRVKTLE